MKQKVRTIAAIFFLTLCLSIFSNASITEAQINPGDPDAQGTNLDGAGNNEQDCAPGSEGCCGGVETSIIGGDLCGDSSAGEAGTVYKLLIGALNILTAGIGIAAVGGIAYGALLYTTAENKPDQTKKAIGIITNVVIGLVAYALMYVLLNFLIPGGVFA